jgi:hypothetical protein
VSTDNLKGNRGIAQSWTCTMTFSPQIAEVGTVRLLPLFGVRRTKHAGAALIAGYPKDRAWGFNGILARY